jgi:potassium/hydrogen antiporter
MHLLDNLLLVASLLIIIATLTSVISFRIGVPLLLAFLGVGVLAGPDVLGIIQKISPDAVFVIGGTALAVILFESGFNTSWQSYRAAAAPAITLATVGTLITTAIVATASHYLFGFSWGQGALLGAMIASTDAAAVFLSLRIGGITLRDRVRSTLEIESGSNDPVAILLTIACIEWLVNANGGAGGAAIWGIAGNMASHLVLGAVLGLIGGYAVVTALSRVPFDPELHPIVSLALALFVFAAANKLGGSGYLAVYIAGLFVGNRNLRRSDALKRFHNSLSWLAQIILFIVLGLYARPSTFLPLLLPTLGMALVLMLVARPVAVALCLTPFRFRPAESLFIGWVGLRGAVSILLAILPILAHVPQADEMFSVIFMLVVISLLIQGSVTGPLARGLGLIVPPQIGPVDRVELDLPLDVAEELVAYTVHPASAAAQGEPLPRWARPALVIRKGKTVQLDAVGTLRGDDHIYLFTRPDTLPLLDRLFAGPLLADASYHSAFYGDIALEPRLPLGAVADQYGFVLPPEKLALTLEQFLLSKLGGRAELGDRVPLGPVTLIVRALEGDHILAVGAARPQKNAPIQSGWIKKAERVLKQLDLK